MRLDRWEGTSSNVHKGLEKVTDGSAGGGSNLATVAQPAVVLGSGTGNRVHYVI